MSQAGNVGCFGTLQMQLAQKQRRFK